MQRGQPTGEALDALIREQAATFAAAAEPPVERIAARVTRTGGFANLGQAASGHLLPLDEPEGFGGGGAAPDPAEAMLVAVGASLSVTLTVHAALAGIALGAVDVALSGELDPARFYRPSTAAGGGVRDLRLDVTLESTAGEGEVSALLDRALLACPVLRSIDAKPVVNLTITEPA